MVWPSDSHSPHVCTPVMPHRGGHHSLTGRVLYCVHCLKCSPASYFCQMPSSSVEDQLSDPTREFATPFQWSLSRASQLSDLPYVFVFCFLTSASIPMAQLHCSRNGRSHLLSADCVPGILLTWFPLDQQILGG